MITYSILFLTLISIYSSSAFSSENYDRPGSAAPARNQNYDFNWSASGDASQYANNWLTAKMTLAGRVKETFKLTAEEKCSSLGGQLVKSRITSTEMYDLTTVYRYQVKGTITCSLSEEGICAEKYNLDGRIALKVCSSIRNIVKRDEAAQCVANALVYETYRRLSFGENRTHILSYCINAAIGGFGLEMANAALTQGSLRSHYNRLKVK